MKLLSSLQNRIFLASLLVALLSHAFALQWATRRVAAGAEQELRRGLEEAGHLVAEHHAARFETLTVLARLIADLPKLKAAVATGDAPTVRPVAEDYRARVASDVLLVVDTRARVLAALGTSGERPGEARALASALAGREAATFEVSPRGVSQLVSVPIVLGPDPPEVLGALALGFRLDDALAARFEAVTGSAVAIAFDGRIWASTLPRSADPALGAFAARGGTGRVVIGEEEFEALAQPLAEGAAAGGRPVALVLRSRGERLRLVRALQAALAGAALVAVLVAVGLSYAVARTVSRPLHTISARMGEMAATGDWTRKIRLGQRWDDADARLLATTFNALTDAIARFQGEAALRERLSALGRLSTVIAHEARNPLMSIKGSLRALRRGDGLPPDAREAAQDIDVEVRRLSRMVDDVLDYARPLRLEPGRTDLEALCREALAAGLAEAPELATELSVEPAARELTTDAERLRTALVNVIANARDAVLERTAGSGAGASTGPALAVSCQARDGGGVVIVVADRGVGIEAAELPHVFEPYVTGKRRGTGLGLAITRNIVDALGGRVAATSVPGEGTQVRIELPLRPPVPGAAAPPQTAAAAGGGTIEDGRRR